MRLRAEVRSPPHAYAVRSAPHRDTLVQCAFHVRASMSVSGYGTPARHCATRRALSPSTRSPTSAGPHSRSTHRAVSRGSVPASRSGAAWRAFHVARPNGHQIRQGFGERALGTGWVVTQEAPDVQPQPHGLVAHGQVAGCARVVTMHTRGAGLTRRAQNGWADSRGFDEQHGSTDTDLINGES